MGRKKGGWDGEKISGDGEKIRLEVERKYGGRGGGNKAGGGEETSEAGGKGA